MVAHPTTSPVRTTNRFLPNHINENDASQIEETKIQHEETINENLQNIVSRRPSFVINLHQESDKQTWRPATKTVLGNSPYKDAVNNGRKT